MPLGSAELFTFTELYCTHLRENVRIIETYHFVPGAFFTSKEAG